MAAGRLRRRVTFQQEVETPDGGGGYELTWADRFSVWGGFRPERGQERLEAGRLESAVAGVLTVRSSSQTRQVTAEWRVMIRGEPYQIRAVTNPDQRSKYLELTVERGVAV